mmetsp:Transcript_3159/g.4571  ORF Transcript_3159/g.4571 Transcript_3159/m.4571 type:complete len:98 (-) Transcript_3159:790-1083(-)
MKIGYICDVAMPGERSKLILSNYLWNEFLLYRILKMSFTQVRKLITILRNLQLLSEKCDLFKRGYGFVTVKNNMLNGQTFFSNFLFQTPSGARLTAR